MNKVSIIVPIYNNDKHLNKCLDTIVNQTYKNIEIILINDGSTDNSLKIMKKYAEKDKRIIIIDKANEGVSTARNIGIKRSSGKYITFVDSDDFLEYNAIEKIHHEISTRKIDIVRSNYQVHYKNSKNINKGNLDDISNKYFDSNTIRSEIIPRILTGKLPCFVHLLMIKRTLLLKTKLFPINIHMMEDVILYLNLLFIAKEVYIFDYVTYNINFNELSATNNKKNYERNILDIINVNKYIKKILKENKMSDRKNILCLNTWNIEAIADFIFKQYLYCDNYIDVCIRLYKNNNFIEIAKNIDNSQINIQRRIIIKLIVKEKFNTLKLYFCFRKILRSLKSNIAIGG